MPIMVGNRDDLIITTSGHVIAFASGEDVFVPADDEVIQQCIQRGHRVKQESRPAPAPSVTAAPTRPTTAAPATKPKTVEVTA